MIYSKNVVIVEEGSVKDKIAERRKRVKEEQLKKFLEEEPVVEELDIFSEDRKDNIND